jgi:MraZ protein
MFRGATQVTLDAKGRMVLPTRYRERIMERCQGQMVVTIDRDHCLLLFPLPEWEVLEAKLMRLPTLNEASRRLQRLMVGHATDIELDAAGRLLLPPKLREFAKLERDVVLVGQGARFELWNEARWNESRDVWLAEDNSVPGDPPADLGTLSI